MEREEEIRKEYDNKIIKVKNKMNVRELEGMYVNGVIEKLGEIVEERKREIIERIEEYEGRYEEGIRVNPVIMQRYFFRSINPIGNREPEYSAEKVAILWDLYNEILLEVNARVGELMPTVTSFCTFAGITLSTFRSWKTSEDMDMRVIVEKIGDVCFGDNVTLAQIGKLKERSTIYRMKSEQQRAESEQPQIHIHNEGGIDMIAINKRLEELQGFNKIKKEAIEVERSE